MITVTQKIHLPTLTTNRKLSLEGESYFKWQMEVRANYLLLDDHNIDVPVNSLRVTSNIVRSNLKWLNNGELIAGSYTSSLMSESRMPANDYDIFFKSKADALEFRKMNFPQSIPIYANDLACTVQRGWDLFNLIHGVPYKDPADLISKFDIRACSTALDVNTYFFHYVEGADHDCAEKHIVYNPTPRNTSIGRLVKYIQKGFKIDAHQRLFLADLIRSNQYDPNLELITGY